MEKTKVKIGASPFLILGGIFTPLGLFFSVLGTVIGVVSRQPMFCVIFSSVGLPFLILGILFLVLPLRKRKQLQAMVDEGKYFWAEVVDVEPDCRVTINGRHPVHLVACMTDPMGNSHVFKSRNIKMSYVPVLVGAQVKVYAKEGNLDLYYVDTDPVLAKIREH